MPFTGNEIPLYDWSVPIRERHNGVTGPYRWRVPSPSEPQTSRGFYLASYRMPSMERPECATHGASFRLRLEWAAEYVRHLPSNYATDESGDAEPMVPLIARLTRGRGYLAGWTLGEGMASKLDYSTLWDTPEEAAYAAHELARVDAEHEREYQERESAREAAEEEAEDARRTLRQAALSIEMLIDVHGLAEFLGMVSDVCNEKAAHVAATWQDKPAANSWRHMARRLVTAVTAAHRHGLDHD